MAQTFFTNSTSIGVDLNNQSSTQLFALGTHVLGNNDSEWVYVQANTSIVGNTMVAFNAAFTCGMASGADLTNGLSIGSAQTSCSSQAFVWIAVRGVGLTVAVTGTSSTINAIALAASGVPTGVISANVTATASNPLAGVTYVTTTVSASVNTVTLSWPRGNVSGQ